MHSVSDQLLRNNILNKPTLDISSDEEDKSNPQDSVVFISDIKKMGPEFIKANYKSNSLCNYFVVYSFNAHEMSTERSTCCHYCEASG